MKQQAAYELIVERFDSQWDTVANPIVAAGVPHVYDNEAIPAGDYLASCTIQHTITTPQTTGTVGTRRCERRGNIFVKVWVPSDAGRTVSTKLLDAALGIFEGQSLYSGSENVTILAGATREIGTDGRWYMATVVLPFYYPSTF